MSEDHQGTEPEEAAGRPELAAPDPVAPRTGAWSPAVDPERLVEGATRSASHTVDLGGGRTVEVYGETGDEGLRRLESTLRSLSQVPEMMAVDAIYVVDEIGSFVAASGEPQRPVEALPMQAGSRLLICRKVLDDDDVLEGLFDRLVRRERLVRAAEKGDGTESAAADSGENGGDPAATRYQGRAVIAADGQITGGVFLSGDGDRPAIVVDHTKDHRLRRLYRELVAAIGSEQRSGVWRSISGRFRARPDDEETEENRVLRYVHATVREHLPPWNSAEHDGRTVDEAVMTSIAERGEPVRPGQKIYLGEYLRIATADGIGGGECVHRSLLVAHLLERLLEDGRLEGSVSLERQDTDDGGIKTWVRFVGRNKTLWVVDATREYVGLAEEAPSPIYLRSDDVEVLRRCPL